jgi:hypothetical protein
LLSGIQSRFLLGGIQSQLLLSGAHGPDGTALAPRMVSSVGSEAIPKFMVGLRVPQLNLCLHTSNKGDLMRRVRRYPQFY